MKKVLYKNALPGPVYVTESAERTDEGLVGGIAGGVVGGKLGAMVGHPIIGTTVGAAVGSKIGDNAGKLAKGAAKAIGRGVKGAAKWVGSKFGKNEKDDIDPEVMKNVEAARAAAKKASDEERAENVKTLPKDTSKYAAPVKEDTTNGKTSQDDMGQAETGATPGEQSVINEGAGAGYTVEVSGLKLGKVTKIEKVDDFYQFEAKIAPGEVSVTADDYYNNYCHDEPTSVKGGTVFGTIDVWGRKDDPEEEIRDEIEGVEIDLSFDYGFGWIHTNLPDDEPIDADYVNVKSQYFEINKISLDAPQLADVVNDGYERSTDFSDENGDGDEDDGVDESAKDKGTAEGYEIFAVYDGGDQYADRYTIVLGEDPRTGRRECLCVGDTPDSPQGFSQFSECQDGPHLGKKIDFSELPEKVQRHVQRRLAPIGECVTESDDEGRATKKEREDRAEEFRDFVGNLEPCVETKEGVIYFQYNKKDDTLEYGSATNTGLAPCGSIPYDDSRSMQENLQDVVTEIEEKFGYLEDGNEE